ncbi:hypothetical protein [Roseiconus lacunae]|uniref:Uncharacterized protein n=1 Tax=Roseiconus lacunae TaxID=2605694 RepID=A0ABT7PDW6_9BACT|nr:hypothetical protein [Roseiconus lacunae]MDM4014694.1 hypothetical protein [Roseiconus lacunae]
MAQKANQPSDNTAIVGSLEKKRDDNASKIDRLREQIRKLESLNIRIASKIRGLQNKDRLQAAIGKPGAVIFSHQCQGDNAGQPAEVLKVNRTRALVRNVNTGTEWNVPFDLLVDADDTAGDELLTDIANTINGGL